MSTNNDQLQRSLVVACDHCLMRLVSPQTSVAVCRPDCKRIPLEKGTIIYCEGAVAESLFVLCRGSVKLTYVTGSGSERIAQFIHPGDLFGLDAILHRTARRFSAVTRSASLIHAVGTVEFAAAIRDNTTGLWVLAQSLNTYLHAALMEKIKITGNRVSQRMQNAGIELGQKGSVTLATGGRKLEVTQRELADFIGVPEETVCRELSRLRIQQQQ